MARFGDAVSEGFDPTRDLQKIGLANQTTMLMSETLKVQEMLRAAMVDRHGDSGLEERFRAFDTICSATQERQDAVHEMLDAGGLDTMIVIGGYNSSNTQALARMCTSRVTTYYIDSPGCIEASGIRYRKLGASEESVAAAWLPAGEVHIGVTAGASTPDSVVGDVIERILALRGQSAADLTHDADIKPTSSIA
jgi:4-hydroxy-3-methylbut-2-enyl diphosphate reductase